MRVGLSRYSSIILGGAQGLWWEGVGDCAPVHSAKFKLIGDINRRIASFAEPLFARYLPTQAFAVAGVWSTARFPLPQFSIGDAGAPITARKPGANPSDIVQAMGTDLIAVQLQNISAVKAGLDSHYLLFLSADLSMKKAGAVGRLVNVTLRGDVASSGPVEPDAFQGTPREFYTCLFATVSFLVWFVICVATAVGRTTSMQRHACDV